jgi:hypothetical protein
MTETSACFTNGNGDTHIKPPFQPRAFDRDTAQQSNLAEDAVMAVAVTVPLAAICIALVMWLQ